MGQVWWEGCFSDPDGAGLVGGVFQGSRWGRFGGRGVSGIQMGEVW